MLHEFFALTRTRSLYRVSMERDEHGWPTVVKIVYFDRSNFSLGHKLGHGRFVGVRPGGICLYTASEEEDGYPPSPCDVNPILWGGTTSNIVALFLDQAAAREALTASELQHCDPRWHTQTRAVLTAIGRHPIFYVVPFPDLPPAA